MGCARPPQPAQPHSSLWNELACWHSMIGKHSFALPATAAATTAIKTGVAPNRSRCTEGMGMGRHDVLQPMLTAIHPLTTRAPASCPRRPRPPQTMAAAPAGQVTGAPFPHYCPEVAAPKPSPLLAAAAPLPSLMPAAAAPMHSPLLAAAAPVHPRC